MRFLDGVYLEPFDSFHSLRINSVEGPGMTPSRLTSYESRHQEGVFDEA